MENRGCLRCTAAPCTMPRNSGSPCPGRLDEAFGHARRCHIAVNNHDFGSGFQFGQHLALLVGRIAAAAEDHPAGSAVHQPSATTRPRPPRPPVTTYDAPAAYNRMAFADIEIGARQTVRRICVHPATRSHHRSRESCSSAVSAAIRSCVTSRSNPPGAWCADPHSRRRGLAPDPSRRPSQALPARRRGRKGRPR